MPVTRSSSLPHAGHTSGPSISSRQHSLPVTHSSTPTRAGHANGPSIPSREGSFSETHSPTLPLPGHTSDLSVPSLYHAPPVSHNYTLTHPVSRHASTDQLHSASASINTYGLSCVCSCTRSPSSPLLAMYLLTPTGTLFPSPCCFGRRRPAAWSPRASWCDVRSGLSGIAHTGSGCTMLGGQGATLCDAGGALGDWGDLGH